MCPKTGHTGGKRVFLFGFGGVRFKKMKEDDAFIAAPKWLERDKNTLSGKVIALPARDDIDFEIAENLIVELYSK